jgi:hypothetical protein
MATTTSNQILLVNILIEAGVPVFLEGNPGTAKSSIVEGLCRSLDRHCETVLASLREPADFGGLPVVTPEGVVLHAPRFAQTLAKAARGVLFLDEITHAAPAVQAALGRVVLDRVVGDCDMGRHKTSIVLAGNSANSGGCNPVIEMLNNRCAHVEWHLPLKSWLDGCLTGFEDPTGIRLPADWHAAHFPTAMARIRSFIEKNPTLAETTEEAAATAKAYPTLRSWTNAATAVAAAQAAGHGPNSEVAADLVISLVGEGAGRAYCTWVQAQDLADPEEVLANAATFVLPTRGDRISTLLDGVVAACLAKGGRTDKEIAARYAAAWVVVARVSDAGFRDIVVPAGYLLAAKRPTFCPVPAEITKLAAIMSAAGLLGTR